MPYSMENVRNLDDEMLAAEIEDVELELSELAPQLAELKAMQGKTADFRDLFDANLKVEELEERWQELTAALQALTAESNKREQVRLTMAAAEVSRRRLNDPSNPDRHRQSGRIDWYDDRQTAAAVGSQTKS
jgi:DNA repair exonuclease SbcCD ATPase subunit